MDNKMKCILTLGVLFSLLPFRFSPIHAEGIEHVFTSMPDSIFSLLTERNRRDMVDFYNNKMEAKVRNRLGEYSQLDTLTDEYLHLTLSKVGTAEMRMLETDDSVKVVCLIQTVAAPVRDSQVRFFSMDWQQLYWIELPMPSTEDFFTEVPDSVSRTMQFAQHSIDDLRLVEIAVSPEAPDFTYKLSCQELAEEEKKVARQYVRFLRYHWTGSQFVRIDS